MSGRQVAEKRLVGLGVAVGALDEDGGEETGDDFGGRFGPDAGGAGREGEGVGLDVAEDEDFLASVLVADEEGGAVVDAGWVDEGRVRLRVGEAAAAAVRVEGGKGGGGHVAGGAAGRGG